MEKNITNDSQQAPVRPESLGDIIQTARQNSNIDGGQLCHDLNLNVRILTAIESGNFKDLPPAPYVRAFLVTLSVPLKLDSGLLIEKYNQETGQSPADTPASQGQNFVDINASINKTPLVLAFAFLALILWVFFQIKSAGTSRVLPSFDTPKDSVSSSILLDQIPSESINEEEISSVYAAKADSITDIEVSSLAVPSARDTIITPKPDEKISNSSQPPEIPPTSSFARFKCLLDSVWINAQRKGKEDVNKRLVKGENWLLRDPDTMSIRLGVPASVEVHTGEGKFKPKSTTFKIYRGRLLE